MFKKIDEKARRKRQHNLSFFILYLECRASVIIYRLLFVLSIFEVKKFIEKRLFLINKKPAKILSTKVWFYDILQVSTKLKEKQIRFNLKSNLRKGAIYAKNPRYIYMNYGLFYGFIYKQPKIKDLAFPKNCLDYFRPKGFGGFLNLKKPTLWFDIYRGTDYN
jgi:ribosomal protein S4